MDKKKKFYRTLVELEILTTERTSKDLSMNDIREMYDDPEEGEFVVARLKKRNNPIKEKEFIRKAKAQGWTFDEILLAISGEDDED